MMVKLERRHPASAMRAVHGIWFNTGDNMNKKNFRNCGKIRGSLSEIQPFIYIARSGARLREQKARVRDKMQGLFMVSAVAGNGVCPKLGVILPFSRCRDEHLKKSLLQLYGLLAGNKEVTDIKAHYAAIKSHLRDNFGDALQISEHESLNGFVSFERSSGLFPLLAEHFDYVTGFDDDPNGVAIPITFEAFPCKSYGEFLEWFYNRRAIPDDWGWNHCNPHIVFDDTGIVSLSCLAETSIVHPAINLADYFTIRPGVQNRKFAIKLVMGEYGWAYLHLYLDDDTVKIDLSNVYPPFDSMFEWVKRIARGDIPAQFDIDEEGEEKRLSALSTDDPDRIFLRVTDAYDEEELFVEGIVSRAELVQAFREELPRFFSSEFNPEEWGGECESGPSLKQRMLSESWLQ